MAVHELKIWCEFFEAVIKGFKTFEIRKNDRNFKVGDILLLMEYDHKNDKYTGRVKDYEVTYIMSMNTPFLTLGDMVVMSIRAVEKEDSELEQLPLHVVSVSDVHSFIEWLNNQKKDYMGGEFLYDVKGYYKRLKQVEMFDYWLERVHSR